MPNSGNRFPDSDTPKTPWRLMSALSIAAGLLLASAVTGCYQPGYSAGYTTPTVTASVSAPAVEVQASAPAFDAQVVAPAPAIDTSVQVGVAPAPVVVTTPDLVTISPDVQVIADYHEPVFFTGGFYWRESNNGWYRSNYHDRGWSYQSQVPYRVRNIDNRGSYRNYRPAGYTPRSTYANRGYDNNYGRADNRGARWNNDGYNSPRNTGNYGRADNTGARWNNDGYQSSRNTGNYGRADNTGARWNNGGYQSSRNTGNYGRADNRGARDGYGSGYNRPAGYQPQPRDRGYQAAPRDRGYQAAPRGGYQAAPRGGYQAAPRGNSYQPRSSQSYGQPRSSSSYGARSSTRGSSRGGRRDR